MSKKERNSTRKIINIPRSNWPKKAIKIDLSNKILTVSIPFTWELPIVEREIVQQKSFLYDNVVVGGPAVKIMPDYFLNYEHVQVFEQWEGVLQKVNPLATRTTLGCPNNCSFCAVKKIEGSFKELDDWPNLPVICDSNLLASSQPHFDKVITKLEEWGYADFNQGLDCRLLTEYHADRISKIGKPIVRLALDSMYQAEQWESALEKLIRAGLPKSRIRSYALIGFNTGVEEAWTRCNFIESHGVMVLPMWFNKLDAMELNDVHKNQKKLGWTQSDKVNIMQYFYKHKGKNRYI